MQNEQNQDRLEQNYYYTFMNNSQQQEERVFLANFSEDQQQNEQFSNYATKNCIFSNQIDFLAVDSYHTIQRASLKIVPDPFQLDFLSKNEEDLGSTLKSSHNSQIFQEYAQSENEMALIKQTSELTLKQCATSIQYEGQKEDGQISRVNRRNRYRAQHIKNAKQLIKELKRQYKYNNEVKGDGIISIQGKTIKLKSAILKPIIDQKRHLSAIIISHCQQQLKIQVVNQAIGYFDPVLQLWDNQKQIWNDLQFKIKLHTL